MRLHTSVLVTCAALLTIGYAFARRQDGPKKIIAVTLDSRVQHFTLKVPRGARILMDAAYPVRTFTDGITRRCETVTVPDHIDIGGSCHEKKQVDLFLEVPEDEQEVLHLYVSADTGTIPSSTGTFTISVAGEQVIAQKVDAKKPIEGKTFLVRLKK